MTLTVTWFCFLPLSFAIAHNRLRLAEAFGLIVLLVLGPNLLGWVIFGTIIGTKLIDWENYGSLAQPLVKAADLLTWCFLYLIALVFTYGCLQMVLDFCLSHYESQRLIEHRQAIVSQLPREVLSASCTSLCAICLESYKSGDTVSKLETCSHRFHTRCIEGWLGYGDQCPTCRQELG
jgi:hypothetical protein